MLAVLAVALVGGASPRYVSAGAGRIRLQGYNLFSELSGWNSAARVAAITTSRDGRIVLTVDFVGDITLANLKNAILTRISGLHRDHIVALALDQDGAYAVTAALDGTVAI